MNTKIWILYFFGMFLPSLFYAQENEISLWSDFKVGWFTAINETEGASIGCEIELINKKWIFQFSYTYTNELLNSSSLPLQKLYITELLFGRVIQLKKFEIHYKAGLGVLNGTCRGEQNGVKPGSKIALHDEEETINLGLPLELSVQYNISNNLSIGIEANRSNNIYFYIFNTSLVIKYKIYKFL